MARIQVTTALKANLPILSEGEFGFSTDTSELFIGSQNGNVQMGTMDDIGIKTSQLDETNRAEGRILELDSTGRFTFVDKSVTGDMLRSQYDTTSNGKVDIAETAESVPFSGVTAKPTTLTGYGITDAAPKANPTFTGTVTGPNFVGKLGGVSYSVASTAPSSPATNDIWTDTTSKLLKRWTGTVWETIGATGGSGATNMSGLTDVDVTTIAPASGNVLTFNSGKWKPAGPTGGGGSSATNTYLIDPAAYGIVQGIPNKPYITAHYTAANANITGINNALTYAYANGYNEVIFPRGSYAICYPNPILTKANTTIDFNFSTFKVIYDSETRSPLDASSNPIYLFGGQSIQCNTSNTHIKNLTLIGDRIDRNWTTLIPEQRAAETSVGIMIGGGAMFSSVRNCNISYYMADAIGTSFGPYSSFDIGLMQFGSLSTAGATVTGTTANSLRSANYISLPTGITSFTSIGLGYAPMTSIPNRRFDVYFYTSSNTFISLNTNVRTRDRIQIPKNATKVKLAWEGNGTVDDGTNPPDNPPYWVLLLEKGIADQIVIADNEIHSCHRGGIFLGVNNVLIARNYIHDVGDPADTDIDGIPTFSDFTRYGITTEDNVGQNCKIIDNVIENVRMAVALRGDYNEVSGNEFRNCTFGLILYYQKHIVVNRNYFYYSGMTCFEYENFDRDWIITENIFQGASVGFGGSGTIASFSNNSLLESEYLSPVRVLSFKDNHFESSNFNYHNLDNTTIIEGCSFIKNSLIYVNAITGIFDRIKGCSFVDSRVRGQAIDHIIIRDSVCNESRFEYSTNTATYSFYNCKITNATVPVISSLAWTDIGPVTNTLELKDCTIKLGSQTLIFSMNWKDLLIQNSSISYTLTAPITNAFFSGFGDIVGEIKINDSTISANFAAAHNIGTAAKVFSESTNKFTNFTLVEGTTKVHSDKMSAIPTTGTWAKGDIIYNTNPTSGGNIGWVCIISGTANKSAWTANRGYSVNDVVNANGKIYKCTKGGTSGTLAPSHTFGTAAVGNLSWMFVDVLAIFKPFGAISN